jgi:outer membrane receptor protein involved in Fe transport
MNSSNPWFKQWSICVLCIALVLLCGPLARFARADDLADEADLQFNLGADRYEAGDFKGALEHFLASNRLVPNKNVLFNIARTYEQLKRAPDAYRYYLLAAEGETNPAAKKRIDDALLRIKPSVAVLAIETDPAGATIFLDRKDLGPRGTAPRKLGLAAGTYKVLVELAGYEPAEAGPFDVKIGQEQKIDLKLNAILGTLVVEGESGAQVRLDSEQSTPICIIPCRVAIAPGRHTVLVSKVGFQAYEQSIELAPKGNELVRARLSAQTGALVVNADVRDALIAVDGKPLGFTPSVLNVPVGRHTVSVSQTGFRTYQQQVEIDPKRETRLEVTLALLEEVTAASRVTESVEDAPASVSIISYQELKAMGYPTIAEAVRGVRGLYLSDDRSYVTIGFRGFSRPGDYGNRVLILLDGQPMNDNYIWSSYVSYDGRVDIDDIERIEVVRGPGSVLYGTSAFLGVINLVTRSRAQPTHGEVAISTAEYGVTRTRGTAVVRLSEDAGFWTTASGARGFGRDFFFPEFVANPADPNAERGANGLPVDGNARGLDDFTAAMFTGRAWWKMLTLQWFLNTRKKTLPTGEYGTIFGDPRNTFQDTRGMLELRFEPRVSENVQLLSRAHFNLYDFDGHSAYPAPDGINHDRYNGRWGGIEQRVVFTPTKELRATIGAEIIRHFQTRQLGDSDAGPYVFDDRGNPGRNDPFTVGAGYLLADYVATPALKLSGGARLDYYSSVENFDLGSAINPRAAVIIKPSAADNVKVLVGKAFRAPSVYELFYTAITQAPASNLQPEQIFSGEIEYTHRFSPTVTATGAVFSNYITNLIELQDLPTGQTQYANASSPVLIFGGEAEVRREWRAGWMLAGTYSAQKASYIDAPTLRDVPNSPIHLASMKGAVPLIGRSLMGMTRITFEGPRPDRNFRNSDPPQGTTDPGLIWDLVLSGEAERLGVRYALGLYNIGDWKYDIVPSGEFRQRTIVQNGRTILANITASF